MLARAPQPCVPQPRNDTDESAGSPLLGVPFSKDTLLTFAVGQSHLVSRVRSSGPELTHRMTESWAKHERRVSDPGQFLWAPTSRVAGWAFFVRPCPDQSTSGPPIGTLTPQFETVTLQCACLALLSVSGGTARHLTPL